MIDSSEREADVLNDEWTKMTDDERELVLELFAEGHHASSIV
jgi:hypothetical protein